MLRYIIRIIQIDEAFRLRTHNIASFIRRARTPSWVSLWFERVRAGVINGDECCWLFVGWHLRD